MTASFSFDPLEIPAELEPLRRRVRDFLHDAGAQWSGWKVGHSWTGFDKAFSRAVAAQGWIGMTWPKQYGGHERSHLERFVVVEEMLAAGAPLGAHWFGDRQSGPLLLRLGTEQQRRRFLPLIASGEAAFCIGLSEPNAGSDLAALRARAVRTEGGWRLSGTKIWTTNAQHCDFMIGLFRTGADLARDAGKGKHEGLSQFLIDMRSSGVDIRPIRDLTGEAHFNEVFFDEVFVPDGLLVGREGDGWTQVTSELAFERSQPDRFMSCFPVLPELIDLVTGPAGNDFSSSRSSDFHQTGSRQSEFHDGADDRAFGQHKGPDRLAARRIGATVADMVVLREMSLSVLGQLAAGHAPAQEAALVKDLGNSHEQQIPNLVRELIDGTAIIERGNRLSELQGFLTQNVPSYSLRGGTREILRGIIAKGLGLR